MNADSLEFWRREVLHCRAELAKANRLIADAASILRLPPDAVPGAMADIVRRLEEWKERHAERGN